MIDQKTIAAFRFGYGLDAQGASDASGLLAQLTREDFAAKTAPIYSFQQAAKSYMAMRRLQARAKKNAQLDAQAQAARRDARGEAGKAYSALLARAAFGPDPFRERLMMFWADHFSVSAKNLALAVSLPTMLDQAIRPHIAGKFSTLLKQAALHPSMLEYLDQASSFGPNSKAGQRQEKGLNENLARELLELHTLGVNAKYTQQDVRQLAELLTGIRFSESGMIFHQNAAEPGAETILGKRYGGKVGSLEAIYAFFDDVAIHPATAQHLATKLVRHFIAMEGHEPLIKRMADAYLARGGELMALYEVMLDDAAAWGRLGAKVRTPYEFVAAGLKALDVDPREILKLDYRRFRRDIAQPLSLMGQPLFNAPGPDGWPEEPEAWIAPAALAGRVQWGMLVGHLMQARLAPRDLVDRALGELASKPLQQSVARSQNKIEAIAFVFASPEFNRR